MRKQLMNKSLYKMLGKLQRQVEEKQAQLDNNKRETSKIDSLIHNKNAQMLSLYNKIDHMLEKTGVGFCVAVKVVFFV